MVPEQECGLFITQVIADRRGASGFQFSLSLSNHLQNQMSPKQEYDLFITQVISDRIG